MTVNFSVWQNVPMERAKSTVPNVAHATLCQQELNGAGYKQTAGCRQFASLFLHFASVQTPEFGKFLTCTLGGTRVDERLSKPVVDGRVVTVKLEGLLILGDSVVVLVLIRIKDAELEKCIGVPRIERDSG